MNRARMDAKKCRGVRAIWQRYQPGDSIGPLGLEPKTLARMAKLRSRERMEAAARAKLKTRRMNDRPIHHITLEESVDEWRPEILEGDGTVQP